MVSDFQKKIYNTHLVVSRKQQDKPFKVRKDFSKLEPDQIVNLTRLEKLFTTYNDIDMEDFFTAPYEIFNDCDYYPISFYVSIKAKKHYTDYMNKLELLDPDSQQSLERLRDSLKFISSYCKDRGLKIEEYPSYCEGTLPEIVNHLKKHKINFYALHALKLAKLDVESDIIDFAFSNFWVVFQSTRTKYLTSKRMKTFGEKAIKKLSEDL